MIIRKCDRCGKTIGTLDTFIGVKWNVCRYGDEDDSTLSSDLCQNCYMDFLEFLSTTSKEEEKDHE